MLDKNLSREHFEICFFFFPETYDLTFINIKSIFRENKQKCQQFAHNAHNVNNLSYAEFAHNALSVNPCPAEPGYALPLQTV